MYNPFPRQFSPAPRLPAITNVLAERSMSALPPGPVSPGPMRPMPLPSPNLKRPFPISPGPMRPMPLPAAGPDRGNPGIALLEQLMGARRGPAAL